MSKKTNFYKIGLFVISGMTVLILLIIILGARSMFEKKYVVETYFDESVQGLDIGSPVKFRGVSIGNVTEITFVQDKYKFKTNSKAFEQARYVLVRIALKDLFHFEDNKQSRQKLQSMINQGLRVKITTKGLTGQAYLELDYISIGENDDLSFSWKPEVFYIPSTKSTFTKIGASIDEFVKKLDKSNIQDML
ncbi:MAG: MlaD family protein, partial [Spirochaetota bacterium]